MPKSRPFDMKSTAFLLEAFFRKNVKLNILDHPAMENMGHSNLYPLLVSPFPFLDLESIC